VKRTFEALTTVVSVTVEDDLPDLELLRLVLEGHPESTRAPELSFELRGGARPMLVCVGHYETPVADPTDLVPVLELDLYHGVAERAAPGWLLHAAALEKAGRALVLVGPSGAGKTTLTLALVARGWRIATEEMVLIERSLAVRGLARPLHAPSNGPQHRAMPASWRQLPYPLRDAPTSALGVIAQPIAAHRVTSPLLLGTLVRIDHGPDRAARFETMSPARAMEQLWPCTLRQDDDGLAAAATILAAAPTRELVSSTIDEAVELILTSLNY
jgi:energy-coupling factor transporter ATP-binding protein EcfA2